MKRVFILLFVAVVTLDEAKSMSCVPGCHYIGQDDGFYKDGKCGCIKWVDYDELINRKVLNLPTKPKTPEKQPGKYYPDSYTYW